MQVTSLVLGIAAVVGMLIGFVPCFGWFNWLNIPFSSIGLIVSVVALASAPREENNSYSIAGVVCCSMAVALGAVRLILGLGIF